MLIKILSSDLKDKNSPIPASYFSSPSISFPAPLSSATTGTDKDFPTLDKDKDKSSQTSSLATKDLSNSTFGNLDKDDKSTFLLDKDKFSSITLAQGASIFASISSLPDKDKLSSTTFIRSTSLVTFIPSSLDKDKSASSAKDGDSAASLSKDYEASSSTVSFYDKFSSSVKDNDKTSTYQLNNDKTSPSSGFSLKSYPSTVFSRENLPVQSTFNDKVTLTLSEKVKITSLSSLPGKDKSSVVDKSLVATQVFNSSLPHENSIATSKDRTESTTPILNTTSTGSANQEYQTGPPVIIYSITIPIVGNSASMSSSIRLGTKKSDFPRSSGASPSETYSPTSSVQVKPTKLEFPGYGIVPSPSKTSGKDLSPNKSEVIPVWTPELLGNAYGGGFITTPSVYVTKLAFPNGPSGNVPPGYGQISKPEESIVPSAGLFSVKDEDKNTTFMFSVPSKSEAPDKKTTSIKKETILSNLPTVSSITSSVHGNLSLVALFSASQAENDKSTTSAKNPSFALPTGLTVEPTQTSGEILSQTNSYDKMSSRQEATFTASDRARLTSSHGRISTILSSLNFTISSPAVPGGSPQTTSYPFNNISPSTESKPDLLGSKTEVFNSKIEYISLALKLSAAGSPTSTKESTTASSIQNDSGAVSSSSTISGFATKSDSSDKGTVLSQDDKPFTPTESVKGKSSSSGAALFGTLVKVTERILSTSITSSTSSSGASFAKSEADKTSILINKPEFTEIGSSLRHSGAESTSDLSPSVAATKNKSQGASVVKGTPNSATGVTSKPLDIKQESAIASTQLASTLSEGLDQLSGVPSLIILASAAASTETSDESLVQSQPTRQPFISAEAASKFVRTTEELVVSESATYVLRPRPTVNSAIYKSSVSFVSNFGFASSTEEKKEGAGSSSLGSLASVPGIAESPQYTISGTYITPTSLISSDVVIAPQQTSNILKIAGSRLQTILLSSDFVNDQVTSIGYSKDVLSKSLLNAAGSKTTAQVGFSSTSASPTGYGAGDTTSDGSALEGPTSTATASTGSDSYGSVVVVSLDFASQSPTSSTTELKGLPTNVASGGSGIANESGAAGLSPQSSASTATSFSISKDQFTQNLASIHSMPSTNVVSYSFTITEGSFTSKINSGFAASTSPESFSNIPETPSGEFATPVEGSVGDQTLGVAPSSLSNGIDIGTIGGVSPTTITFASISTSIISSSRASADVLAASEAPSAIRAITGTSATSVTAVSISGIPPANQPSGNDTVSVLLHPTAIARFQGGSQQLSASFVTVVGLVGASILFLMS